MVITTVKMTANLCGENAAYWEEAERVTIESLQKRIELWDGVYAEIIQQKKKLAATVQN